MEAKACNAMYKETGRSVTIVHSYVYKLLKYALLITAKRNETQTRPSCHDKGSNNQLQF